MDFLKKIFTQNKQNIDLQKLNGTKIFEGMDVWQYDAEQPFHYDLVRQQLKEFTLEELETSFKDPSIYKIGKDIKIVNDPVYPSSRYFVFPDGKAVEIAFSTIYSLDRNDPDILEYLTSPVYSTMEGEVYTNSWWINDYEWVESETPVETISFRGRTDFYERFGWWPYMQGTKSAESVETVESPLTFMGEALFHGEKGYMFAAVDTREMYFHNELGQDILDAAFALILENNQILSPWIVKRPLPEGKTGVYEDDEEALKRLVPKNNNFPRYAIGCQDNYTLNHPFNNFFYQLPVTWSALEKKENGTYKIIDDGTYTISHNNLGEFRAAFQCT